MRAYWLGSDPAAYGGLLSKLWAYLHSPRGILSISLVLLGEESLDRCVGIQGVVRTGIGSTLPLVKRSLTTSLLLSREAYPIVKTKKSKN